MNSERQFEELINKEICLQLIMMNLGRTTMQTKLEVTFYREEPCSHTFEWDQRKAALQDHNL